MVVLVELILAALQIGGGNLVADFVEVKECSLKSGVRATGSLQGLLDEGAQGKSLLLLGTL